MFNTVQLIKLGVPMHIDLSKEFIEFIENSVKSGYYKNGAEVVREALRRMIREETRDLRYELMKGIEQLNSGDKEVLDIKKIRKEALEKFATGNYQIKDSVKP